MGLYYVVEQTQVGFLIRIFSDREKKGGFPSQIHLKIYL